MTCAKTILEYDHDTTIVDVVSCLKNETILLFIESQTTQPTLRTSSGDKKTTEPSYKSNGKLKFYFYLCVLGLTKLFLL